MPAHQTHLVLLPGGPTPAYRIRPVTDGRPGDTGLGVIEVTPAVLVMSRHPELLEQVGDAFLTAARDLRAVQDELVTEPIGAAEVVGA